MNTRMYRNEIVQKNLHTLKDGGFEVIDPAVGMLACGDVGDGKMPEPEVLLDYLLKEISHEKDMEGQKVLVTAGPTVEAIDPVRYITNHSTGKMGYALAKICMLRGAEVTLVTGPTALKKPPFVKVVEISSAKEMFEAVTGPGGKAGYYREGGGCGRLPSPHRECGEGEKVRAEPDAGAGKDG